MTDINQIAQLYFEADRSAVKRRYDEIYGLIGENELDAGALEQPSTEVSAHESTHTSNEISTLKVLVGIGSIHGQCYTSGRMHWQHSKVLQVILLLLILCAGISAQTADVSARHHSAHHQSTSCDLCLVAHAPALVAAGALHGAVLSPRVTWRERYYRVEFLAEPELARDASRGPPSRN